MHLLLPPTVYHRKLSPRPVYHPKPSVGRRLMEQVTDGDGITYELELGKGKTGYKNVVELRAGQFHAKFVPEKGGEQVTLPGPACKSAKEAAIRLAKYLKDPQPLVKQERAEHSCAQVCCRHATPPA